MILKKLPLDFQKDKIISTIAGFFQKSQVLYSSIIYKKNEKTYIINKNQNTPYFSKDWQCYSLLRAISNTFVTTGSIIRNEKTNFSSLLEFGDKNIQKMYENLKMSKKSQIYVITKTMKKQDIQKYINKDFYKILPQQLQNNKKKQLLFDILDDLKIRKKTPILVECGTNVMNGYFEKIEQKIIQNQIDTTFLTFYQGQLNQQSIGSQFKLHIQKYTDCVWQSEPLDVFDKNNNKIGRVHFKVYQTIK